MPLLDVFGLRVDSDVAFATVPSTDESPVDLVIRGGPPRAVADDMPRGRVLSEVRTDTGALWSATVLDGDLTTLRLPNTAEFTFSAGRIGWQRDPRIEPAFMSVLVPGMCLATYLQLQGHQILHASAVYVPRLDGVIAFVGDSGMGKSTMAALLAADGAQLFTDDILRVDTHDAGVVAHRGTAEARLRPAAAMLAGVAPAHETADGRTAVQFATSPVARAPLLAIIFPSPDRSAQTLHLEAMSGGPAVFRLLEKPRLFNWTDPQHVERQFDALASLVDRVPVFASRIPWGPPFPLNLGADLISRIAG